MIVVLVIAAIVALDLRRTRRLQAECDARNARDVDENGEWDPRKYTIWGY